MTIEFFATNQYDQKYLSQKLTGFDLVFHQEALSEENLPSSDTDILCVFVDCPVTKPVLDKCPKLKFIATRSTGFDHIDMKECQARSIIVSNVPTYGENTVAEFAFALLLALSRKLYPAVKQVKEEGNFFTQDLQGFDLKGKTIGIVGAGHIGMHMVKMALGFDMKVLAFDPHPKQELAKQFGFEYADLNQLLSESDVVSLHVPYLPATHHIINAENIKLMKKGAVLINTARGGLVDTQALLAALKSGQLAGAGMDVLEEEGHIKEEADLIINGHPKQEELMTLLADHELMEMSNVLVTPHNAFNSREALDRILDTTAESIKAFMQGSSINLVKI